MGPACCLCWTLALLVCLPAGYYATTSANAWRAHNLPLRAVPLCCDSLIFLPRVRLAWAAVCCPFERYALDTAEGVRFLHSQGAIHRYAQRKAVRVLVSLLCVVSARSPIFLRFGLTEGTTRVVASLFREVPARMSPDGHSCGTR